MNALKHGLRSKKLALMREESIAFENRRMKWLSSADPDDDMGEFLVHQYVSLSFEIERVERAHLERLTSLIENSDESEFDAVHELGKRLFFDPTGPTPMYGNRPDGRRKLRTSWNGQAVDPNDPAVLARQLESSAMGCCWMRDCWEELKAQLEPGKFWQSHDRLKAIRLLGRQPLDAVEDRQVAEIFVVSSALDPAGHKPFDDLLSDMGTTEHVHYRKAVRARWPDLVSAEDTARCRQILIDLADRNIERLDAKLEVYAENADANAQRTVDRLGFDQSPEGNRIRQYKLKCNSGFFRAIEAFRKYQRKKKAEGEPRRIEEPGRWEEDSRRRIPDAGRWAAAMHASDHVPDGSFVSENDTNDAKFDESAIIIQNRAPVGVAANSGVDSGLDKPEEQPGRTEGESDHVSNGSFVVGDGEREALEPSIDWDALPDRDAQPGCGTGTASATQSPSATMMAGTTVGDDVTLSDGTSALASVTLPEGGGRRAEDGGKTDPRFLPPSLLRPPPFWADGITRLEGSELDAGAGDAGGNSRDVSDANAIPNRGDGMSPQGENSENHTNEANFDEKAIIIQNQDPVRVTANSGVVSGLDKREEQPGRAEGNEELIRDIPASSPRAAEILRPHLPRSP